MTALGWRCLAALLGTPPADSKPPGRHKRRRGDAPEPEDPTEKARAAFRAALRPEHAVALLYAAAWDDLGSPDSQGADEEDCEEAQYPHRVAPVLSLRPRHDVLYKYGEERANSTRSSYFVSFESLGASRGI